MIVKFPIGIRVEFLNSRYNGDEHRYYDDNLKYSEGDSGFVVEVDEQPFLDTNTEKVELHYRIKVGQITIIEVPESDLINPNASLSERVEQRLRQKQEKKQFKDTEGRIGGSVKEKRAYKLISLEDLKNIEQDESTAIELIKKDKVYPVLNVNLEIENGVSTGTAYLKKKLRDAYPPKPLNNKRRDVYVGFANYLVNEIENIYTINQFEKFCNKINENISDILYSIAYPEESIIDAEKQQEKDEIIAELQIVKGNFIDEQKYELQKLAKAFPESLNYWGDYKEGSHPEAENVLKEIQSKLKPIYDQLNDLEENYFSETKKDFIFELVGWRSTYVRSRDILKKVYGDKFYNLITKNNANIWEEAQNYEPLTEIESNIAIDKYSASDIRNITHYESLLNEINTAFNLQEMINIFEKYALQFKGGDFGNKWFAPKDIKNIQQADLYKKRWVSAVNENIEKFKSNLKLIKEKYRERESDWSWFTNRKVGPKGQRAELTANSVPFLSYIKRVGGYKINDDEVNTQFIKDKFGFKEVEFGQSLKDEEAKSHIHHFLSGMADLGDILDLDIFKLNKLGGLSISFASRGSGKASATYGGLRKIINITKTSGGGALAHEYMHYIDNIIPKIDRENYTYEDFASDYSLSKYGSKFWKIKNDSVSEALSNIFDFIEFKYDYSDGNFVQQPQDAVVNVQVQASQESMSIPTSFNGVKPETIEEYLTYFFDRYPKYQKYENFGKKNTQRVLGYIVYFYGLDSHEYILKSDASRFYTNSKKMKSDYWIRKWELLARGFETYIFDKLAKANRSNNYLVSGLWFDREEGVYPYGDEREILFKLYDKLIESIKYAYDLEGFKPWTTERVDEYIALDEKGSDESGVVVDDETGEVEDKIGDYSALQKKFIKLAKMINSQKNNKKKKQQIQ